MSATKLTLENFIKLTPVCRENTNLKEILKCFLKGDCEEIAIVNYQNFPTGTLHFRSLMPYLLKQQGAIDPVSAQIRDNNFNLLAAIEPVAIFPTRMTIAEFCVYWQSETKDNTARELWLKNCALVKESGEFVGFLDGPGLVKHILAGDRQSEVKNYDNLPSQQDSLFSLLEKLPLPLSLETNRGIPLYQNLSWREKVEGAKDRNYLPLTMEYFQDKEYASEREKSQEVAVNVALERNAERLSKNKAGWEFVKLPLELSGTKEEQEIIREKSILSKKKTLAKEKEAIESEISAKTAEKNSIWLILANESSQQQKSSLENTGSSNLNRLKDELLASITHELKSPLTAIVGLSNLLQEKKLGELNQRQGRYAEQIYQSGQQLMRAVNQLLDLTALETGQLKLTTEAIEIQNVCDRAWKSILGQYRDKIESKKIEFNLEIEKNLHEIVADELRLHQILVYLLENALMSLGKEGKISLRVSYFYGEWIAFTVKDNGKQAIAEESQYLATLQLQKSQNTEAIASKSNGLGLVMSDRLAKAQGGDLAFICTENKGNEFKILLRSNQKLEQVDYIKSERLVLVVESRSREIENLTDKLKNLGYKFIVARSGTEALSKARKFQPDGIFIDPYLPLLGGWEVLQALKSDFKTQNIPVYVTSILEDKESSLAKGANGFLTLPVKKQALQQILIDRNRDIPVQTKNLTILCLQVIPEKSGCLSAIVNHQLHGLNHRILEADSLEQAEILARIWEIDAIVLEGTFLDEPQDFLRAFSESHSLAALPLITMDAKTTEAANKFKQLSVFPCLVPLEERGYSNLLEVIQIAAKLDR